jgi:hypothetical protein
VSNFPSISWREQGKFQWDDDDVRFVTKLRQTILGDKDPITVESLDFFASVYAKVGAEQYEGLLLLNAIFTYYIQLRLL